MHDISEGLPKIAKEKVVKKGDYMFEAIAKTRDWKCRSCLEKNSASATHCRVCN